jgi:hypothetical protein
VAGGLTEYDEVEGVEWEWQALDFFRASEPFPWRNMRFWEGLRNFGSLPPFGSGT